MSDFEIESGSDDSDFETSWIDEKPSTMPAPKPSSGFSSSLFGGGGGNKVEEDAYDFEVADYGKGKRKGDSKMRASYNDSSSSRSRNDVKKGNASGSAVSKSTSAVRGDESAMEKAQRMLNSYSTNNGKTANPSGVRHKTRLPESYEDDYSLGSSEGSSSESYSSGSGKRPNKNSKSTAPLGLNKSNAKFNNGKNDSIKVGNSKSKTKTEQSSDFSIEISLSESEAAFSVSASDSDHSGSGSDDSDDDAFNDRLTASAKKRSQASNSNNKNKNAKAPSPPREGRSRLTPTSGK